MFFWKLTTDCYYQTSQATHRLIGVGLTLKTVIWQCLDHQGEVHLCLLATYVSLQHFFLGLQTLQEPLQFLYPRGHRLMVQWT